MFCTPDDDRIGSKHLAVLLKICCFIVTDRQTILRALSSESRLRDCGGGVPRLYSQNNRVPLYTSDMMFDVTKKMSKLKPSRSVMLQ
jgi:hypothetical protein